MGTIAAWGDFDIHFDGVLGRGGMGSVYRAWQRSVGRWVAVKVLHSTPSADPELHQGFLQKFQIEIQALARLNDPRIVTILQAGENDGRLWFAMELIDGETVEKRLSDRGAFDEEEAARIGIEVARALDAALRQKIIHRDVKPANIFLLRDGSVKLADFGLARSAELARTRLTDLNAVACTPEYASPEQGDGRATDHRSDLYSLGCVLYEMVAERPPFAGESQMATLYKHATEPAPSPRTLNPGISPEYETVVRRCLEKDPEDRFQGYAELIDALLPPTEPMIPAARPVEAPRSWMWPAAVAAGLTLLAIILLAIFSAETAPSPVEAAAPARREPLLIPPARPVEKKEAPAATPVVAPEIKPEPAPRPPAPLPEEEKRPDPALAAAEALEQFRASLPPRAESELMAEIPWGTWNPDLLHAPGGGARFDPAGKTCVLTARSDADRVWIKRKFAGVRAGYEVQFRLGSGSEHPRAALALSFTRWLEVRGDGASLFRLRADGSAETTDQKVFESRIPAGRLTVVPGSPDHRVFLDDRLLFTLPAAECADAEGLQIGASGGTVFVDSVRVKDRTR
ncbi:MAG: protein kinase [Planctomycetes bacterium]|nr:protein kinase [Planctomycetota bacterium]